ncbi:alpha-(1,6)-fucosyltransferase-like isoform X2 [Schistocerca gregaria]|uniref:alpha-(1,6)-fucosyltransferase-like isoform X2 n=1 Tax=Schistocerca gregaria TaxID=7010 RepID=UPI00211E3B9B|nr:alpha-(1,6)-fucosyltransferase-like isoform X2 [Schistocerca gregaria]
MATASYLYHPCHTIPDRPLQSDIDDQAGVGNYEVWWECEATQLSDLGQRQLHSLENPQDCNIIRKFICTISKVGGWRLQSSYSHPDPSFPSSLKINSGNSGWFLLYGHSQLPVPSLSYYISDYCC